MRSRIVYHEQVHGIRLEVEMARGEGRQRICEAAVRLFNEEGYDSVSLRQIAAEAGTTIGNLTYHFARKEDLLEAILEDLHQSLSVRLDRTLRGADIMRALLRLVAEGEANYTRYPFYYQNLSQLASSFPAIKRGSDEFAAALHGYYTWAFEKLQEDGWIDGRTPPNVLAYVLVGLQVSWAQASSPYCNTLLPAIGVTRMIVALLRGHVTDEVLGDYDALCVEAIPEAGSTL